MALPIPSASHAVASGSGKQSLGCARRTLWGSRCLVPPRRLGVACAAPSDSGSGGRDASISSALAGLRSGADFNSDQLQIALAKQLKASAEQDAAGAAERIKAGAEAGLDVGAAAAATPSIIPPRRPSRAALKQAEAEKSAEVEKAARRHSFETQHRLASHAGSFDDAALASALRMQLQQSGTFDEANTATVSGNGNGNGNGNSRVHRKANSNSNDNGALLLPEVMAAEDGCLLFTSDALHAVHFEDVLAP